MRRCCAAILLCAGLAGCGFDVQAPDLFVMTQTGPTGTLTMLVNDSGTISCNGGKTRSLPDPLLLQARDLATSLDNDAKAKLTLPRPPNSVYSYKVTLQDGTVTFPDTAAAKRSELAQAEQFALAAAGVCGVGS